MNINDTPKTNWKPVDLAQGYKSSAFGFKLGSTPVANSIFNPQFTGRLAEKNFADLIQNDDIRNKNASYIIGGRMFDAVVDVNGGGDYLTIQEALDAGEKRIFVRAGIYIISIAINIIYDDVLIVGENKSETTIQLIASASSDTILMQVGDNFSTYENITFQNLTFDGNDDNQAGDTYIAIKAQKINNLNIVDCNFKNWVRSYAKCINLENNVDRVLIQNCKFIDFSSGIDIDGDCKRIWILNNYFTGTGGTAMYISHISQCIIAYNFSEDVSVFLYSAALVGDTLTKMIITNNISNNVNLRHIVLNTATYCEISNNIFNDSNQYGLQLATLEYCKILNNTFVDCGQLITNTYTVIKLSGGGTPSTYNTIKGNIIRDTKAKKSKYGIWEDNTYSTPDYNIITDNIIQGIVTQSILINGTHTIKANNIE